ncbi:wax ester/triacylglycerol synthase family O-acyltransferase [Gordonia alkaliphila]|uniref:diacylglycerol O-acyltransferase n=2 Tax=Gordonia alkaliphila TaxID=1053547 RepID=A0ABP8YUC8_9ACTN
MGAFDAVMYGIEGDPLLRTGIVAFIALDGSPDPAQVSARVERLTRIFPRLRERAVGNPISPAPPRWEIDPNFDPSYHVRWRRLPDDDATMQDALDYAARVSESDFDHSRPLWEIAIVTGLVDGRAAVVFKIHHSVADGMGGLAMSAALFDLAAEPGDLGPLPDAPDPEEPSDLLARFVHATRFELDAVEEVVVGGAKFALRTARDLLTSPLDTTVAAGRTALSAAAMLAPQGAPKSRWMADRSLTCTFTLIEVPLAELKAAAHRAEVTLNVVFMAAVADAVGTYHRRHGHDLPELRVNMPVNQRRPGDEPTSNHWAPARFLVPAGDEHPAPDRLTRLQRLLEEARTDPALGLSDMLYKALALLPDPITERLAGGLMKGVDVAATNVPGPPVPVYLCGAKVDVLVPFAPKSGAAINVALLTYDDAAFVGINSDPAAVEDPAEFTACLAEAFAALTAEPGLRGVRAH